MEAALIPRPSFPQVDLPSPEKRPNAVWSGMMTKILPGLRSLLVKTEKDPKDGSKLPVVRPPVALALLKIIKLLPPDTLEYHLTRLLMSVCGTLRCRDSNARDSARSVLNGMIKDMGAASLSRFIKELTDALKEGFHMHVRTFTLHSLLGALAEEYVPPEVPSIDPDAAADRPPAELKVLATVPPFDACVRTIVDLLLEDIFGEAAGAKEADAEVKSTSIKEAKGQKALDAFELLGRCILFRPTFATANPGDPGAVSSIHAIISPLLWKLHESESPRIHAK
jgi:U3 small nucleolar RNA-associated protein 20